MNKANYWQTRPEKMNILVDDMIEVVNRMTNDVLVHTHYLQSKDQLLEFNESVDLVASNIIYLMEYRGSPSMPEHVKTKFRNSLKGDFNAFIEVTEILRLRILTSKQVRLYENNGLLIRKKFTRGHGCSWDFLKRLIR